MPEYGAYFFVKDRSTTDPELMASYRNRCCEEAAEMATAGGFELDMDTFDVYVCEHRREYRWEFVDGERVPVKDLGYWDSVGWKATGAPSV
jgi:hypothetical protein